MPRVDPGRTRYAAGSGRASTMRARGLCSVRALRLLDLSGRISRASFSAEQESAARGSYSEEAGQVVRADHGTLFLGAASASESSWATRSPRVSGPGTVRPLGAKHDIRVDVALAPRHSKGPMERSDSAAGRQTLPEGAQAKRSDPSLRDVRRHRARRCLYESIGRRCAVIVCELHGRGACSGSRRTRGRDNVEELEHVVRRVLLLSTDGHHRRGPRSNGSPTTAGAEAKPGPWSGLVLPMAEWEREAVREALAQTRGNKSRGGPAPGSTSEYPRSEGERAEV